MPLHGLYTFDALYNLLKGKGLERSGMLAKKEARVFNACIYKNIFILCTTPPPPIVSFLVLIAILGVVGRVGNEWRKERANQWRARRRK